MSDDGIFLICVAIVLSVAIFGMSQCAINQDNNNYEIEKLKIERGLIKP